MSSSELLCRQIRRVSWLTEASCNVVIVVAIVVEILRPLVCTLCGAVAHAPPKYIVTLSVWNMTCWVVVLNV